jgi:hypothetical protein
VFLVRTYNGKELEGDLPLPLGLGKVRAKRGVGPLLGFLEFLNQIVMV